MTDRMFSVSLVNAAGKLIAGLSNDGVGDWSHYQEPDVSTVSGFVEIDGLATSDAPALAATNLNSTWRFSDTPTGICIWPTPPMGRNGQVKNWTDNKRARRRFLP